MLCLSEQNEPYHTNRSKNVFIALKQEAIMTLNLCMQEGTKERFFFREEEYLSICYSVQASEQESNPCNP